jgi:drug/metabolite transporter (DMT)-like permease
MDATSEGGAHLKGYVGPLNQAFPGLLALRYGPVMMLPMVKFINKEVLSWKAIVGAFVAVSGVAILFLT